MTASMKNKKNISIIISAFKERENILNCLSKLENNLPNDYFFEIIFITTYADDSYNLVSSYVLKANHLKIKCLKHYSDIGKGHAIKTGITVSTSDIIIQFDADLQFDVRDIEKIIQSIDKKGFDLAFACRFMKESELDYKFSFFRVMGNIIVNHYLSFLYSIKFYDITTGLKGWTRSSIEEINFIDNKFLYEAEIACKAAKKGYKIAMIPCRYYNRTGGISGHGQGLKETMSVIITGVKILIMSTLIKLNIL